MLLPGLGGADGRVGVDEAAAPWRSVLKVQTELGVKCSGFLIAPAVAVTAAHCLWIGRVRRFIRPGEVHVLAGYRDGAYRAATVARTVSLAAGYNPLDEGGTAGLDVAVLALAAPVGEAVGRADGRALTGTPAMLGGFGQDRAQRIDADLHCRLTGVAQDGRGRMMIGHDCQATHGTSGAPLLVQGADGAWRAIGVQVLARSNTAGGFAALLP